MVRAFTVWPCLIVKALRAFQKLRQHADGLIYESKDTFRHSDPSSKSYLMRLACMVIANHMEEIGEATKIDLIYMLCMLLYFNLAS